MPNDLQLLSYNKLVTRQECSPYVLHMVIKHLPCPDLKIPGNSDKVADIASPSISLKLCHILIVCLVVPVCFLQFSSKMCCTLTAWRWLPVLAGHLLHQRPSMLVSDNECAALLARTKQTFNLKDLNALFLFK